MKGDDTEFGPFIEGEHIYLREVRASDVTHRYYSWMNDPTVCAYLETRFIPQSTAQIESYVREMEKDSLSVFLAIVDRQQDRHIGNIKIGPINWIHRFADLSLVIGEKDFWGKGYGAEAISLVSAYAFHTLNLQKLSAGIYADNIGSIKAFKKAGFSEEGLRKKQRFLNGVYVDEVLMGRTR